jgi:hypothetical protein
MQMSLWVEGVRSDVVAVGELGDDEVAELAERIAAVLGRSLPTRVLELLSEAAAELTEDLPEGRVEVRVAGDEVALSFVGDVERAPVDADADLSARITLRLGEGLKARVEERANAEGASVNAYIVRMLERGTTSNPRGGSGRHAGTRLRGFGTS